MSTKIQFFNAEEAEFRVKNKGVIRKTIEQIAADNKRLCGSINVICCSDEYLLQINRQFLDHDYYTDIITFDHSVENRIAGELYISIDRIRDNSERLSQDFDSELYRVIYHGILHLCGHSDKRKEEQEIMRKKEDKYLKFHRSISK